MLNLFILNKTHEFHHSLLTLTVLAFIPLLIGILILYYFIPTGTVDRFMLEKVNKGSERNKGVNLLCSSLYSEIEGNFTLLGTFVYNNNDPTGQSIRGLFYLVHPFLLM